MMKLTPVTSSAFTHVGHDPDRDELHVTFKSGKGYVYENVTAAQFEEMMKAGSIGAHFALYIKPGRAVRTMGGY